MVIKKYSGICPRCGSNEVGYINTDSSNLDLQRSKCICNCNSCDLVFQEYFQITYAGFSFEDQNGESHEFNENGREI